MGYENYAEKLDTLTNQIKNQQKELISINSKHTLLSLIHIDEMGLHWIPEFSLKYTKKTTIQGLEQYSKDLSSAISKK